MKYMCINRRGPREYGKTLPSTPSISKGFNHKAATAVYMYWISLLNRKILQDYYYRNILFEHELTEDWIKVVPSQGCSAST